MQRQLSLAQRATWAVILTLAAWGFVAMARHDVKTAQHTVHGVVRVAERAAR
jgi:hypothetical protein